MNKLNHILAVLDGSDADASLVTKAVGLAHRHGATLELFLCDAERAYSLSHAFDPRGVAQSRQHCVRDAKRYLECLRDAAMGADVPMLVDAVLESPLYEGIVRKVLRSGADLVIKSAARTSTTRPGTWTDNDWQLMRACPSTLLLSRGKSWQPLPKLAAAVDVSPRETAELPGRILETCRLLSAGWHASIDVLFSEPRGTDPTEHQVSVSALQTLSREVGLQAAVQVLSGAAEQELPSFCARQDYDVLVLGALSHRDGLTSAVGTLTEKLVEALDCDFVLVKPSSWQSHLRATTMDSVGPNGSTDMSRNPVLASHPWQSAGV